MEIISNYPVPTIIAGIIFFAYLQGVDVFNSFLIGAGNGLKMAFRILPSLVALITAVGFFRASGALDMFVALLEPLTNAIHFPKEVVPLAILRPISGSGALVIFNDILQNCGPDSFAGRVASVIEGSTETTFYTIAVYFGAVSINKTRHTAVAALSADFVGFLMSAIAVTIFFGGI